MSERLDWIPLMNKFFKGHNVSMYNSMVLYDIEPGIKASITPYNGNVHDHYIGLKVQIISKTGVLATQLFIFDRYLIADKPVKDKSFEVLGYCCSDGVARWYMKTPTDQSMTALGNHIIDFCNEWAC